MSQIEFVAARAAALCAWMMTAAAAAKSGDPVSAAIAIVVACTSGFEARNHLMVCVNNFPSMLRFAYDNSPVVHAVVNLAITPDFVSGDSAERATLMYDLMMTERVIAATSRVVANYGVYYAMNEKNRRKCKVGDTSVGSVKLERQYEHEHRGRPLGIGGNSGDKLFLKFILDVASLPGFGLLPERHKRRVSWCFEQFFMALLIVQPSDSCRFAGSLWDDPSQIGDAISMMQAAYDNGKNDEAKQAADELEALCRASRDFSFDGDYFLPNQWVVPGQFVDVTSDGVTRPGVVFANDRGYTAVNFYEDDSQQQLFLRPAPRRGLFLAGTYTLIDGQVPVVVSVNGEREQERQHNAAQLSKHKAQLVSHLRADDRLFIRRVDEIVAVGELPCRLDFTLQFGERPAFEKRGLLLQEELVVTLALSESQRVSGSTNILRKLVRVEQDGRVGVVLGDFDMAGEGSPALSLTVRKPANWRDLPLFEDECERRRAHTRQVESMMKLRGVLDIECKKLGRAKDRICVALPPLSDDYNATTSLLLVPICSAASGVRIMARIYKDHIEPLSFYDPASQLRKPYLTMTTIELADGRDPFTGGLKKGKTQVSLSTVVGGEKVKYPVKSKGKSGDTKVVLWVPLGITGWWTLSQLPHHHVLITAEIADLELFWAPIVSELVKLERASN